MVGVQVSAWHITLCSHHPACHAQHLNGHLITANTYVQDTMKIGCQTSFNRDALHMLLAGDQVYSTEVRRWCPDRQCFAASQDQLPTGQADVFEVHAPRFSSHLQLSSALVGISNRPHPSASL